MVAPLRQTQAIDLLIDGPASGTIVAPHSVGFRCVSGSATILTNQPCTPGSPINFAERHNGEPYFDIPYTVDAASQLQILGLNYIEV